MCVHVGPTTAGSAAAAWPMNATEPAMSQQADARRAARNHAQKHLSSLWCIMTLPCSCVVIGRGLHRVADHP